MRCILGPLPADQFLAVIKGIACQLITAINQAIQMDSTLNTTFGSFSTAITLSLGLSSFRERVFGGQICVPEERYGKAALVSSQQCHGSLCLSTVILGRSWLETSLVPGKFVNCQLLFWHGLQTTVDLRKQMQIIWGHSFWCLQNMARSSEQLPLASLQPASPCLQGTFSPISAPADRKLLD
ncbi:hypothetical protein V5799_011055 [Amblyomma americanum]|uniref:Uncharacterized protein n=1 Tax=Amblyomma americanum TaxID=6943 RepID=A0AAQ4EIB5_AMBAM